MPDNYISGPVEQSVTQEWVGAAAWIFCHGEVAGASSWENCRVLAASKECMFCKELCESSGNSANITRNPSINVDCNQIKATLCKILGNHWITTQALATPQIYNKLYFVLELPFHVNLQSSQSYPSKSTGIFLTKICHLLNTIIIVNAEQY